jgi:hypothetical protein
MVGNFYQPQVWVDGPRVVEAIYNQIGSELRVSLINGITGRPSGKGFTNIVEVIPIHDVKIVVRSKRILRATDLAGRMLSVTSAKGRTVISVPRLMQYDVISLARG